MSDELLSQEQARQLRMMCHACLDQLGGNGVFVDEEDRPSTCRLCPVGDCLVLAEFSADPGKSRFRQIDLFMVESGGDRFRLDPKHRLASFRAKHLGKPEDWHLQLDRPPELWFGPVTVLMLKAPQPVMDQVAPLQ
jgi:hypothetical protein